VCVVGGSGEHSWMIRDVSHSAIRPKTMIEKKTTRPGEISLRTSTEVLRICTIN